MKYILIYLLNLADYATTVYLTGLYGIACEVNPLMRYALSVPRMFAVVKLILFPLLLLWMWRTKKRRCGAGGTGDVYRRCSGEYQSDIQRIIAIYQ